MLNAALDWLAALPPLVLYLLIGAGAAVENIVPPIPADTFVLFGGFLAARGRADPWLVFLATWVFNVGSALAVYGVARRHDETIRESRVGQWLLNPHQLERIATFYQRWGTPAIFFSRFFPALRAIVPVFAGLSDIGFFRMALPTAIASGLWYGLVVYLGAAAGRNWEAIQEQLGTVNIWLLAVAVLIIGGGLVWWWRTRGHHP
ncbi:MAG: DedA family protein [Longimicrobiales bacterium]